MTTDQSASLAVHGEAKRGNTYSGPKAPSDGGGDTPAIRPAFFTIRSRLARLGAPCAALLLGACSLLPTPSTHVAYHLPQPGDAARAAQATAVPWSVRVATPQAIQPWNSRQVIIRDANASLASYAGIRWADTAPALLRERLAQHLADSGRFAAVGTDRTPALADIELASDLRAFQLSRGADGNAVEVRLDARLIDLRQRQILDSRVFSQRITLADGGNADAMIAAFGVAVDRISVELTDWLAAHAVAGGASAAPTTARPTGRL